MPLLAYMYTHDPSTTNRWHSFCILTVLLSCPNVHTVQVGWNSRNSNSIRGRTVSAALYNMAVQTNDIIASNIYREGKLPASHISGSADRACTDDRPEYHRGNGTLLVQCLVNICLYLLANIFYTMRNRHRERHWRAMTASRRSKPARISPPTGEGQGQQETRLSVRFLNVHQPLPSLMGF